MAIQHHVIDPRRPVVQSVADILLGGPVKTTPDLSSTLVIVPTRQAGRRLREVLALRCAECGTGLLAPMVAPPSLLIAPAEGREMTPILTTAVWTRLLLDLELKGFRGLFPVDPPEQDFTWAMRMGRMLQHLRETLAEGNLTVAEVRGKAGEVLEEPERWENLERLEALYLARLGAMRVEDNCRRILRSAEAPHVPEGVERVVMTPLPDATACMTRSFETLSRKYPLDVILCRDAGDESCMDAWGRPDNEYWQNAPLPIPDAARNLRCCANPAAQSRAVMQVLAEEQERFGPDDVAIGVPDATLIPFLRATLDKDGVALFDPAGQPARHDPVYLLLAAFHELFEERTYIAFSRWLRQPEFLRAMEESGTLNARELLEQADTFQNDLMPMSWADILEQLENADPGRWQALRHAVSRTQEWFSSFGQMDTPDFMRMLLADLYGKEKADSASAGALERVQALLDDLQQDAFQQIDIDSSDRFLLLLEQLAAEPLQAERHGAHIDLLGWVELAWDDAPLLIVTGMNEGHVPEHPPDDAFLPDSLRTALGLRDDRTRHARDAYLMHLMLSSRRDAGRTVWMMGRTGVEGDPMKPSRLLFHCPSDELPQRVAQLFQSDSEPSPALPRSVSFRLRSTPDPRAGLAVSLPARLHVTDFSVYLNCPYRFYLSRVCRMEALGDNKAELDALEFGSLIHAALEAWAKELLCAGNADAERDAAFLEDHLQRTVRLRYGHRPSLSILMQAESGIQRLRAAALFNAGHAGQGWEVVALEKRVSMTRMGMEISGKIDRIDRHRESGALRILDYKTSETARDPRKEHLRSARDTDEEPLLCEYKGRKQRWCNLQLPLYRMMIDAEYGSAPSVEIGYFNLPRAVGDTGIVLWDGFNEQHLEAAAACADHVIGRIRDGVFWPPAERMVYDDYKTLFPFPAADCLDTPPETAKEGS